MSDGTKKKQIDTDKMIYVSWYHCDCDWITKYCDDNHRSTARVPVSVLKQYKSKA